MRIFEITQENQIVAVLHQLDVNYHNQWLTLKNLLDFLELSGDPLDPGLIDTINLFETNLSLLLNLPFDEQDPDIDPMLEEVRIMKLALNEYRSRMGF